MVGHIVKDVIENLTVTVVTYRIITNLEFWVCPLFVLSKNIIIHTIKNGLFGLDAVIVRKGYLKDIENIGVRNIVVIKMCLFRLKFFKVLLDFL